MRQLPVAEEAYNSSIERSRDRTQQQQRHTSMMAVSRNDGHWRRRPTMLGLIVVVLQLSCWTSHQADAASSSVKYTEAYFDGTNYIRLGDPMPIWSHSAISFRSCKGGDLISQSLNQHQFLTIVDADSLRVIFRVNNTVQLENRIPAHLLDNQWHTIEFQLELGKLNLIVDKQSPTVLANSTFNSALLTDQEIRNNAAILILGKNYSGCLFHGPGFNFQTLDENTDQSVLFGPCPMTAGNCSQSEVRVPPVDHCLTDPCMQHGSCTSRINGYECHCTARYSGKNCEVDTGPPCLQNPCKNDGLCQEDARGNYQCSCGPHYTGIHCETEINFNPQCMEQCMHNATCSVNAGVVQCDCQPGFTGIRCETDMNDCVSDPCLNNGQCIDGINSFRCNCSGTGYTGKLCQENVNECAEPGFCQHNGVCYDTYGSFTCVCQAGYGGNKCERPLNECDSQPCSRGATCMDKHGGRFECICPNGLPETAGSTCDGKMAMPLNDCDCQNGGTCNGTHCECPPGLEGARCERVEPCSSSNCVKPHTCLGGKCVCPEGTNCEPPCPVYPCENGGVCLTKDGNQFCQCPVGFNGTYCETNIYQCSTSPTDVNRCHHGVCVNQTGLFRCYCTPGYTGVFCDSDVNECLTQPCKNGATCKNLVNNFECICPPGYDGKDCSHDIDECASNPCHLGSTCVDKVAEYECHCIPGMMGKNCEIDIDDCLPNPCHNHGHCTDQLNGYHCNCSGTGFSGNNCEVSIDECESSPCMNNGTCQDEVNDFTCECKLGYSGKMCEIDIDECESSPCQYNGTCYQRSNRTLYELADKSSLPDSFSKPFSYETASGYECVCIDGIDGDNCENNIDECVSSPCAYGKCVDEIGYFTCSCFTGYEGDLCETEIDECERYTPCVNGNCHDRVGYYLCKCTPGWGGVNCSVLLTGCSGAPCENNGTCSPTLENEVTHLFNCSCGDGFQGDRCEKETTISMVEESLLTVNTSRVEGYDINLRFRTTLPNGILVFGSGGGYSYILELVNGRLNLHSSLLNKWEGVFIGSTLNNSEWQKVFVSINNTHLLLSANEETTIYPINAFDGGMTNQSYTTFPVTYLGGTIPHLSSYLRHLTHAPSSFVGCMQDVVINGQWVFPNEANINQTLVSVGRGCPRTDKCAPNPCHSGGHCIDEWHKFSCVCQRPNLGKTCQFNITAATFGHENTTHSTVVVNVGESQRRIVRSVFEISMFIKTRHPTGEVFYMGSDSHKSNDTRSFVSAKLNGGELLVRILLNGQSEEQPVGGNHLDNGYMHFLQVIRNSTLVQVKINGTEYFRKTLSVAGLLDADVLYLGGPSPDAAYIPTRTDDPGVYFKGIMQDVQVSNGSYPMTVELYPLNESNLSLPASLGEVIFDENSILKGEVTDDMCRSQPCFHDAECRNTWNDYICICPRGHKGKQCQETQFCEMQRCPGDSTCQNLDDGYECLSNTTFQGNEIEPLSFSYNSSDPNHIDGSPIAVSVQIAYRAKVGGTMLYVRNGESFFGVAVFRDQVTVQWRLTNDWPDTERFQRDDNKYSWDKLFIRLTGSKLEGGFNGWQDVIDPIPAFSRDVDAAALQELFSGKHTFYLGGMPRNESSSTEPKGEPKGQKFKGCLGEVRVGGLLLPYFSHSEIYPDQFKPRPHFRLNGSDPSEGCIVCFQTDCLNGGVCDNANETYACTCPAGYEDDDCSHNIDECLTAQCTNNSTCIDQIAAYKCECKPGYDGRFCENEINECLPQPCHNGGNCTDLVAAFTCECTEEYSGPQCDFLRLVTCENNPCRNGSTCTDGFNGTTGNNFTCACRPGLEGVLCDIPFCNARPCQNGGFCLVADGPPMCQCSLGYTGVYCEADINECASEPCQNGGRCTDLIGSYRCNCDRTGFEGVNCETDINECLVKNITCGERGQCENTRGSFRCNCMDGLCGPNCNLENPCKASPSVCMNGGICMDACANEPDYVCNCTDGFIGKNCTEVAAIRSEGISPTDIAIIVVPIVVALLAIAGIALTVFLMMARNKRATRGTYSPSAQEYCNPRLEMDNVLKPPPEERLI